MCQCSASWLAERKMLLISGKELLGKDVSTESRRVSRVALRTVCSCWALGAPGVCAVGKVPTTWGIIFPILCGV